MCCRLSLSACLSAFSGTSHRHVHAQAMHWRDTFAAPPPISKVQEVARTGTEDRASLAGVRTRE